MQMKAKLMLQRINTEPALHNSFLTIKASSTSIDTEHEYSYTGYCEYMHNIRVAQNRHILSPYGRHSSDVGRIQEKRLIDGFYAGGGIHNTSRGHQQVDPTQTLWNILITAAAGAKYLFRNLAASSLLALLGLMAVGQPLHAEALICLTCHSAPSSHMVRSGGKKMSPRIDPETLASSAHSKRSCLDCHIDFRGQTFPHKEKAEPVNCIRCHHIGNQVKAPDSLNIEHFADSVHGSALKAGDQDAPKCKTCHGTHDIRHINDSKSTVYRTNIPKTCGKCHFDSGFAARHKIANVGKYRDSIHAIAQAHSNGFKTAAVCTDCHGVHDIKAPGEKDYSVSRLHVPATCGKCHKAVLNKYKESIHGRAVAKGNKSAPVCTDCHGEHLISAPSSPDSSVYPLRVVVTCSKCHASERIETEYGLPKERLETYRESYHGIANRFGDVTVANCASCHGSHDIRASSDPKSSVNKKNLPRTCGKCHSGANKNFAKGKIHVVITKHEQSVLYYVSNAFKWLTIGTMMALIAHIGLDLFAKYRKRRSMRQ